MCSKCQIGDKKNITIKHEFKNFPILRILAMNIKRIGAKLPKLNIRLEKRKKKRKKKTGKKACYASNLCKKK